jgi:hypothetical protein
MKLRSLCRAARGASFWYAGLVLAALGAAPLKAGEPIVEGQVVGPVHADGAAPYFDGAVPAEAGYGLGGGYAYSYPTMYTWHAGYYHVAWGKPVALVVPPTATYQTNWGWGVGNTRITPISPQFQGPMMGQFDGVTETFRPTPYYVSDTLQFGVYYIRGPW